MIDLCSQESSPMSSIEDALARIKNTIHPLKASETVLLKDALGRILLEAVYAPINSPNETNSAMDGYAFSSAEITKGREFSLNLIGTSWAGRPFKGVLQAGQCIRVFTGAVVPSEADSIIMQEHVESDGQWIHFPIDTIGGQHIREVGEDMQQGSLLFASPKKLNAIDLGLLASAGVCEVSVSRPVKIAFFSTGDELTELGKPLFSGQIYDSNRYALHGLLNNINYIVTDMGVIGDDKQLLEESFIEAAKNHDVIITTGGVSVGEADYVKEILSRCGEVNFWKIAIKPGKPLAFGKIGDCYFFGLPGNPVAVIVTFQYIVSPALKHLLGATETKTIKLAAICTSTLKKAPGRQEYQRGILTQDAAGNFFVASSGKQGSNIMKSLSEANCYIVLPVACEGIQAGERVMIDLIPSGEWI
jgi:molybdopterin molybdotransferase